MPEHSDNLDLAEILGASSLDFGDSDLSAVLNPPDPEPDPLANVEYQGNVEEDSVEEASELLRGFKERKKAEKQRFRDATDSEFWVALCFQTREQKEQFLRALDLMQHGDKYLDGRVVAKKLGVELPEAEVTYREPKGDRKLAELT